MEVATLMLFARVQSLDGIAITSVNVCKDTTVAVKSVNQLIHANTTTATSMQTVFQVQQLSMRTVTNVSAKMDSKETDTSAMSTSHLVTVSLAVTMKSDKLSATSMALKHVSADVPKVSRTVPTVALQWALATTTTAILKQHAFQLEHHTVKDSHANVTMD